MLTVSQGQSCATFSPEVGDKKKEVVSTFDLCCDRALATYYFELVSHGVFLSLDFISKQFYGLVLRPPHL